MGHALVIRVVNMDVMRVGLDAVMKNARTAAKRMAPVYVLKLV